MHARGRWADFADDREFGTGTCVAVHEAIEHACAGGLADSCCDARCTDIDARSNDRTGSCNHTFIVNESTLTGNRQASLVKKTGIADEGERSVSDSEAELANWESQLRKGSLMLAVLATLRDTTLYELEIRSRLEQIAGFSVSEGVLYPILRRLRRMSLVEAEWVEPEVGHPRRYFRLTADGRRALVDLTSAWLMFTEGMQRILAAEESTSGLLVFQRV
jgi:PadR family transcriptional regulator PadR